MEGTNTKGLWLVEFKSSLFRSSDKLCKGGEVLGTSISLSPNFTFGCAQIDAQSKVVLEGVAWIQGYKHYPLVV